MRSQLNANRVVRVVIDILGRMRPSGSIQLARVPAAAVSAGEERSVYRRGGGRGEVGDGGAMPSGAGSRFIAR